MNYYECRNCATAYTYHPDKPCTCGANDFFIVSTKSAETRNKYGVDISEAGKAERIQYYCPSCKNVVTNPAKKIDDHFKCFHCETVCNHYRFDSKVEMNRWFDLLNLQRAGEITDLAVHPEFLLMKGKASGEEDGLPMHKRKDLVTWTLDFYYIDKQGNKIVEDVKGGEATKTEAFKIKKKLFLIKYKGFYKLEVMTT